MSDKKNVIDLIIETLSDPNSFGFEELTNADDEKKFIDSKRHFVNLNADHQQVLFNGYIELHNFGGLLLIEPKLKVLAFILLEPELDPKNKSSKTQPEWFEEQLSRINMLLYALRQKCGQKYGNDICDYTVEVLFVVKDDKMVKQQLNQIVRTSQLIHLISVNYLQISKPQSICPVKLKEVLPWLLIDYSFWHSGVDTENTTRLAKITTANYRLPDGREIEFNEHADIHLFHGHNGSGKSTLAETIELLNTGKLKRLAKYNTDDYYRVLSNTDAVNSTSSIEYIFSGTEGVEKQEKEIKIEKGSCEGLKTSSIPSTSFMLNQSFIDELVNSDPAKRYIVLYGAFFGRDIDDFKAYKKNRAAIDTWSGDLWLQLDCRGKYDDQVLLNAVSDLLQTRSYKNQLEFLLPVKESDLRKLAKIEPSISSLFENRKPNQFKTIIQSLNKPLADIGEQVHLHRELCMAKEILAQYDDWWLEDRSTDESYEGVFDLWCEQQAKIDFLSKRLQLAKLCDLLDEQKLAEIGGSKSLVLAEKEKFKLSELLVNYKQDYSQLTESLEQNFKMSVDTKAQKVIKSVPMLTGQQIKLFNKVGRFLTDKSGTVLQGLGNMLAMAINNRQLSGSQMRSLCMDEKGWGGLLQQQLEELAEAVAALTGAIKNWKKPKMMTDEEERVIEFGASAKLELCVLAKQQLSEIVKKEQGFLQNIVTEMVENKKALSNALNELLCLFTPARWLYKRLHFIENIDIESLKISVEDNEEAPDINAIWNTAELNLMAVTLFLLCVNRTVDKREVSTLVMDDPLQNMDELTTAYFARGLAKLNAFWRKKDMVQQLIMLFHGEQAIETFKKVLPAAVYKLPWLGQSVTVKDERLKNLKCKQSGSGILSSLITMESTENEKTDAAENEAAF